MMYTVITAKTIDVLVRQVTTKIHDGWTPQGGVSVMAIAGTKYVNTYQIVSQAMVKV